MSSPQLFHSPPSVETVFLDRDGVINEKMPEGQYVRSVDDFRVLPGVSEAIRKLNNAAIRVIVISNQRGVSLGLYTADDVATMHRHFQQILRQHHAHTDGFYFCPHNKGQCNCRKPLPGMFEQAVAEFPTIAPATSIMIGDSLSDIEFGHRLGMRTFFLEGDPSRRKPGAEKAIAAADHSFQSLLEAVDYLLG
jgi:D-glycero-D-manno-heptose 1,7-bisphosphate phosphatase